MMLPQGWYDVTVEQFQKLLSISVLHNDVIDKQIAILSLFSGKMKTEFEAMNVKDIVAFSAKLKFLEQLPEEKITTYFEVNGNKYKACLLTEDMKAGQFIDFNHCGNGCSADELPYHMQELIGAMCLTRKHWNDEWKYVGYDKTEKDFLALPLSIAYPLYVFFCNVSMNLQKPILDYSQKTVIKQMKKVGKTLQLV